MIPTKELLCDNGSGSIQPFSTSKGLVQVCINNYVTSIQSDEKNNITVPLIQTFNGVYYCLGKNNALGSVAITQSQDYKYSFDCSK